MSNDEPQAALKPLLIPPVLDIEVTLNNPTSHVELGPINLSQGGTAFQLIHLSSKEAILEVPDGYCSFGEKINLLIQTKSKPAIRVEIQAKIGSKKFEIKTTKVCTVQAIFEVYNILELKQILNLLQSAQETTDQVFSSMKD